MRIAVLREGLEEERRVALTPDACAKLIADGHTVAVQTNAGEQAGSLDGEYLNAGATVVADRRELITNADAVLTVTRPEVADLPGLGPDQALFSLLDPLWRPEPMAELAATGTSALSLELVPRITRAQSMDVLSSMATVAGYQAVLTGAQKLPRMFPMLMTAAGTVPAARVFVLGAGVAGLQAIATARRLGAVVEGFDIRPAAAEQIRSLGAKAVELNLDTADSEDSGGYAKAQADDEQTRQREALTPLLAASDVVITTAAIPGVRSPLLITTEMVEAMRPGSMVIDLAAARGGNCEATVADEEVAIGGVTVVGPTRLESESSRSASLMFANNLVSLLRHLTGDDTSLNLDPDDEITSAMLVTAGGSVVHERVAAALAESGGTA